MTTVGLAHTYRAAPDSEHVVVFLWAIGSDRSMWSEVTGLLGEAGISTLTVDHRGHGGSAVDGPFGISDMADDVLATVTGLDVGSFDLVGISLGGAVAQHIAVSASERVASLTLLSTLAKFGTPEAWRERADEVRAHGTAPLTGGLAGRWVTEDFAARRPEVLERLVDMVAGTSADGYAGCAEALGHWDGRAELSAIAAPTLVIGGAQDRTATPDALAELARGIPGSVHRTVPGAHLTPVEQPAAVAELIRGHVDAASRSHNLISTISKGAVTR